jgi:hypothetical protein
MHTSSQQEERNDAQKAESEKQTGLQSDLLLAGFHRGRDNSSGWRF